MTILAMAPLKLSFLPKIDRNLLKTVALLFPIVKISRPSRLSAPAPPLRGLQTPGTGQAMLHHLGPGKKPRLVFAMPKSFEGVKRYRPIEKKIAIMKCSDDIE